MLSLRDGRHPCSESGLLPVKPPYKSRSRIHIESVLSRSACRTDLALQVGKSFLLGQLVYLATAVLDL